MQYGTPCPITGVDTESPDNKRHIEDQTLPEPFCDETGELFPEPEIQRLLHEIANDLDEVRLFVSKLNKELASEKEPKERFTAERRKRIFA